jgi:phospholipase C
MALSDIETIIIVIMENRSFDHMSGYLSLDGAMDVEGLRKDAAWQASFANVYKAKNFGLFPIQTGSAPCSDPEHDFKSIALQIKEACAGQPSMGGFVESFAEYSDPRPSDPSGVMGYQTATTVPTFDFFAKNYCVCDHWFSALPLGTQANRLMAMAGESKVLDNAPLLLPSQDLVYDWLTSKNIPWCAYQSGDFLPFFALMPDWLPEIATSLTLSQLGIGGGRFRRYTDLQKDWQSTASMPAVVFVEPEYTDGPHSDPNDDHAPTGIAPGQAFIADLYQTLISNPVRWANTMLIVTYDEHGGFFDHVPPISIPAKIDDTVIETTGVRVPAFIVSPYVTRGHVFHGPLDHTSLLQLLDDRFVKGEGYSVAVNQRQYYLDRILNALSEKPRSGATPLLEAAPRPAKSPSVPAAPSTANAQALHAAAQKISNEHPELLRQPGWEKLNAYMANPVIAPRS